MSDTRTPAGPYAGLADLVRQKRETSGLAAELHQLAKDLRQRAEQLFPKISRKRLWGLLIDGAEEAETLAKDLEGRC